MKELKSYFNMFISLTMFVILMLVIKLPVNAATVTNPTTQYMGVDYSAEYDAQIYYDNYVDLQNAFGTDGGLLIKHYVEFGKNEKRNAKERIQSPTQNSSLGSANGVTVETAFDPLYLGLQSHDKNAVKNSMLNIKSNFATVTSLIEKYKVHYQEKNQPGYTGICFFEIPTSYGKLGFLYNNYNMGNDYSYIFVAGIANSPKSMKSSGSSSKQYYVKYGINSFVRGDFFAEMTISANDYTRSHGNEFVTYYNRWCDGNEVFTEMFGDWRSLGTFTSASIAFN